MAERAFVPFEGEGAASGGESCSNEQYPGG
jgi:hypothetical protein